MSVEDHALKGMLPRPEMTDYAIGLCQGIDNHKSRDFAFRDIVREAHRKWSLGHDLCIIIRRPTDDELIHRMQSQVKPVYNGD